MLCEGCKNPVIDGSCACPGIVADLREQNEALRAEVKRLKEALLAISAKAIDAAQKSDA